MPKARIESVDFTADKIDEAVKMITDAVRKGLQVSGGCVYKDEIYAVTVFHHDDKKTVEKEPEEGAVA